MDHIQFRVYAKLHNLKVIHRVRYRKFILILIFKILKQYLPIDAVKIILSLGIDAMGQKHILHVFPRQNMELRRSHLLLHPWFHNKVT